MNKMTIMAVAIAAITAGEAMADTTLYGRARMAVAVADSGDNVGLYNNSSRIGFKGNEDLGGGLSAIYHFEFGYNADEKSAPDLQNRIGMVGLKGDFGTFAMGNMWVPTYSLVNGAFDPFNNFGLDDGYQLGSRAGDAIAYSNKFGNISFGMAVIANEADTDDLIDGHNIAVKIPVGPVTVGVGITDNGTDSASVIAATYKTGDFSVGVQMNNAEDIGKDNVMTILATMSTGSGKVLARFSDYDLADITSTTLGYHHNLSKRTQAYLETYSNDNVDRTVVGLKHNF